MRRMVLMLGAESSATRVSLTALMERVHSDGGIPPGRKCFLRMYDSLTWEPAKFVDGLQAVGALHQRYPTKPGLLENVLGGPLTLEGDTVTAPVVSDAIQGI